MIVRVDDFRFEWCRISDIGGRGRWRRFVGVRVGLVCRWLFWDVASRVDVSFSSRWQP